MTHLKAGDKAPDFKGKNQNGNTIDSRQLEGIPYVLYFYPKDNTPGCTNEAKNLRDFYKDFKDKNIEIIGVSPDSISSHKKFADKHNLPFSLIADQDKEILKAFGLWGTKKMFGKEYQGVNQQGIITEVFKKVKTKEHAQQIFSCIKDN